MASNAEATTKSTTGISSEEVKIAPRCTVCNAPNATECATCKSAWSCSRVCQQDDERNHKILREEFVRFTSETHAHI